MRETSCSAQRQLGSPPTTSLAGWIAAGRHARTLDLDHGRVGAGRGGRQWRKAARCTQRHMGGCARCPGSGEPPPAAEHDGANDSPAWPRQPQVASATKPDRARAPLHWLALPCLRGTFVRWFARPGRPAGGGGPVDPARPSVDRAAAGGISCACECDPGRPRPAADLDVPVRDPSSCMHKDKA